MAALAVVASLVSAVVAVAPVLAPPDSARGGASPVTPVLSLRRAPGFLARTIAEDRLGARVGAAFAGAAPAEASSCLLVAGPGGEPLYDLHAEEPVIPASTLKLATATAALARMGPDATFVTEVRAGGDPAGGVVGDLWLVGGGDPLLATQDFAATAGPGATPRLATPLEALADAVVATGLRRIQGRVLGDESRYDTQRYLPTWSPSYASTPEIGPQSALAVNEGITPPPDPRPSPAPAANSAAIFARLLGERGVAVEGGSGQGPAPPGTGLVASLASPPLAQVLGVMLANSSNLTAELVTKELGVRFGAGGTTAAGTEVVREALADLGIPTEAMTLRDGSGLDRGDRLTCGQLQAILAQAGSDGLLTGLLAVAGRDGTLTHRLAGTPAAGRVRAKTGSLDGVAGLAGYATGADGLARRFSLVGNGVPSAAAGVALGDAVALALVAFPDAPAPAALAPLPAASTP